MKIVPAFPAALSILLCSAYAVAAAGIAGTSDGNPWADAAQAKGYAEAAAHKPGFDDREVWPSLSGKERYLKQKLTGGRTLVWAKPGQSAGGRKDGGGLDAWDGGNWKDAATGKALGGKLHLDKDTDIVLPAADEAYLVNWSKPSGGEHQPVTVRSVTVQRNAGWRSAGVSIHGNLWIKRGGSFSNHGASRFVGSHDTFFRNDNSGSVGYEGGQGTGFSQYYQFAKSPDASVELLGHSRSSDECRMDSGVIILGPDSVMQPGRNATPRISPKATLALMDGARFLKWCNQIHMIDLYVEGTLQGGLPERPLQRDAFVGISYQNTNGTPFVKGGKRPWPEKKKLDERITPMLVAEGARVRSYSEDPSKASLVITWCGLDAVGYYSSKALFRRQSKEMQTFFAEQLGKLPTYVTAAFAEGAEVDGVRFERFLKGGILLDGADPGTWKNVYFGPDNQATAEKLYTRGVNVNFGNGTYKLPGE